MASVAVCDAVETYLAANWTGKVIGVTSEDNAPATGGSDFVEVEYPVANEEQASVGSPGSNRWREEGAFRIVACIWRDKGRRLGLETVDQIRDLFRGKSFSGVETFAPSPATLIDRDGNYLRYSFAVPYQFDFFG